MGTEAGHRNDCDSSLRSPCALIIFPVLKNEVSFCVPFSTAIGVGFAQLCKIQVRLPPSYLEEHCLYAYLTRQVQPNGFNTMNYTLAVRRAVVNNSGLIWATRASLMCAKIWTHGSSRFSPPTEKWPPLLGSKPHPWAQPPNALATELPRRVHLFCVQTIVLKLKLE